MEASGTNGEGKPFHTYKIEKSGEYTPPTDQKLKIISIRYLLNSGWQFIII